MSDRGQHPRALGLTSTDELSAEAGLRRYIGRTDPHAGFLGQLSGSLGRRGHCELGLDVHPRHRLPAVFTELALAIRTGRHQRRACRAVRHRNSPH